jgi:phosphoglucosamine mutase
MNSLFGTDGIRGRANRPPMDPDTVLQVGRALVHFLLEREDPPLVVVGRDTRRSGPMIEAAVVAGISSAGGRVRRAGVMPTPGVARLTVTERAGAGLVISASHNPYFDNGIKIFRADGRKLSQAQEARLEAIIADPETRNPTRDADVESIEDLSDPGTEYRDFLLSVLPGKRKFEPARIVIDCANGATSSLAERLFVDAGMDVRVLSDRPDGFNINAACGSEHLETLVQTVRQTDADVGLAFDGDGDRLMAVDETGRPLTGDQVLAVCAAHLLEVGRLHPRRVVSTVMSNMGLTAALNHLGVEHVVCDVGDRHVMEKMVQVGAILGGENSGHMIFSEHHTTGDGMLTALMLLQVMQKKSQSLSHLSAAMTVYPQALENVAVHSKPNLDTVPEIEHAIRAAKHKLNGRGRVLVRYSGTQPVCRVMVEGPTRSETQETCRQIAHAVHAALGTEKSAEGRSPRL